MQILLVIARQKEFRSRRGDGGSDVQHVQLGVVTWNHPRTYVPALGVGNAAPAFVTWLARFGDRASAPQLRAGYCVVRGDDAAVGTDLVFAAARRENLAVGDARP